MLHMCAYMYMCIHTHNVLPEASDFLLNINFPLLPYEGVPILLEAAIYPAKNYISNHPVQIGVASVI